MDSRQIDAETLDVLHLDMDCFFAAVEAQRDPGLAGKPVVVGGTGPRGVVASASYEARVFGIRSAMPTAVARGLCPNAVFLPGRFDEYAEVSRRLRAILTSVTPVVEPIAMDEAYLDVSGARRLIGSSSSIAQLLRCRVRDELQLDCAVGVGRTKLIAKLASRAAKPMVGVDGVTPGAGVVLVDAAGELAFLHRHPVRALPGVGPRTAERLARFGVSTVGDLASVSRESLVRLLGRSSGQALHELARGRDDRPVVAERVARSIGHEETFADDIHDVTGLTRRARESAAVVAARCREAGVQARTITVKVRFADFSTVTRSRTLSHPVATAAAIGDPACELIAGLPVHVGVRLIGVHVSGLVDANGSRAFQLELFGGAEVDARASSRAGADADRHGPGAADADLRDRIEAATEAIRQRYGSSAIASLSEHRLDRPRGGPTGPTAPAEPGPP